MNSLPLYNSSRSSLYLKAAAVALCATVFQAQALDITIDPSSASVTAGDHVTATIKASGLGNLSAPSLGAFDLTLNIDPGVLTFGSITFGDPGLGDLLGPVSGSFSDFSYNAGTGSLNFFSISLDAAVDVNALQPSQFILAVIDFVAVSSGTSGINFGASVFADADGAGIVPDTIVGSSVVVAPGVAGVPDGGSIPAGLAIVAVMLGARRLRRS